MQNNTTEILHVLLNGMKENPQMNLEDILKSKAQKLELNDEQVKELLEELTEVRDTLSRFTAERKALAEERKDGGTRDSFVAKRIQELTEGKSEEEADAIAKAIVTATSNIFNPKQ